MTDIVLRFVRHEDVERYQQEGWTVTNDLSDCYGGQFAVLMMGPNDGGPMLLASTGLKRPHVKGNL